MTDWYQAVLEAVDAIQARCSLVPTVAFILGTGLGGVGDRIRVEHGIPYDEIPRFPVSTVESHKGELLFGTLADTRVVVMQGRLHYYEGYTLQEVTLPVRIMRKLGAKFLMINSAVGGLDPLYSSGDVVIVMDHINLMGDTPLRGVSDPRLGERFPDLSRPYSRHLIELAAQAAADNKITVRQGVYAGMTGPNLETPAETRMLRMLGADVVGMSTVPEVIVANQVGFETLFLAAVTNVNRPEAMEPISIEQVIANAKKAEPKLAALMEETVRRLTSSERQGAHPTGT